MKAALLFPGQGAQYFGMGKDLYEHDDRVKQIYKRAEALLGWQVADLCFGNPNELIHQTRYTQAALFTTNYAIYKVLEEADIHLEAMLGFSLGEYNAITASGALDFENTLQLVEKRAIYMDECAKSYPGGMSAVLGLTEGTISAICQEVTLETGQSVAVANDNCEGQVTIAGEHEALSCASERILLAGAKRVVPLKVSGAFHTVLMQEASEKLKQALEGLPFKAPQIPVISNVTARRMKKDEIIHNIPLQVTHGVRFRESILYLQEQGIDTFIEAGPKCTLSRLVKQVAISADIMQVEDCETLKKVIEKVGRKDAD